MPLKHQLVKAAVITPKNKRPKYALPKAYAQTSCWERHPMNRYKSLEVVESNPPESKTITKNTALSGNKKLGDNELLVVDYIIRKVILEWPTNQDQALRSRYTNYCATSEGFAYPFTECLEREIRIASNMNNPSDVKLLRNCKKNLEFDILKLAVFQRFQALSANEAKGMLKECRDAGSEIARDLKKLHSQGARARREATWIGIERVPDAEIAHLNGKYLVELEEYAELGLKSGVLNMGTQENNEPNFTVLQNCAHRICAPGVDDDNFYSIILWTKDGPNDTMPMTTKIFGGVVYGLDKLTKAYTDFNKYTRAETEGSFYTTREKTSLDRTRIISEGKMAKSEGVHSVYSIPYGITIPNSLDDDQVRIPMKDLHPIVEGRNHEFISGFLPEFAVRRLEASKGVGLINELGYPQSSGFGTYDYSASSHLDKDEAPTTGLVIHRPAAISRKTKNFVWTSYRLILELENHCFWFWDASNEEHGTTTNDFQNINPKPTSAYIRDHAHEAQWTKVSVLPQAVSSAYGRKLQ